MLEDKMLDFLTAWTRDRADESGAYEYYSDRLGRGITVAAYEKALLGIVVALKPSRVVHAGIGFGSLDALLEEAGIRVIGYELDKRRAETALAMRDVLGMKYEIRPVAFPDGTEGRGGTLIFTNVGAGWDDAAQRRIVAAFKSFDTVLLDLRLFGRVREEADRAKLAASLKKIGKVEPIETVGGAYYVKVSPR